MKLFNILFLLLFGAVMAGQQRPFLPGYYAEPYATALGGYYIIYASPDGDPRYYKDAEPLAWVSLNFASWRAKPIKGVTFDEYNNPGVIKGEDGKYYFFHTNKNETLTYVKKGDKPLGPFGESVKVGNGLLKPFKDPNSGKVYLSGQSFKLYELENDKSSTNYLKKIVKTVTLKNVQGKAEKGSVLYYNNGFYYLFYTRLKEDDSFPQIEYIYSKSLFGNFTLPKNYQLDTRKPEKRYVFLDSKPALMNVKGQHFLFFQGNHYSDYKKEHTFGHVHAAELKFAKDGSISSLEEVKDIVNNLPVSGKLKNIAVSKPVVQMPYEKKHIPVYVNDGNFITGWSPLFDKEKGNILTISFTANHFINRYEPYFEYPEYKYRCRITYSRNYKKWWPYADFSKTPTPGYKIIEKVKKKTAKYVRIEVFEEGDLPIILLELKAFGEVR